VTSVSRSRCCDRHARVRVGSRALGSSSSKFGAEVDAYTFRILVAEERSQPIQAREEYSVTESISVQCFAAFKQYRTVYLAALHKMTIPTSFSFCIVVVITQGLETGMTLAHEMVINPATRLKLAGSQR
jgi:hypothetical protein